jgi:hypothetical protein
MDPSNKKKKILKTPTYEERIFSEIELLEKEISKKSTKNSGWSVFFSYMNPLLTLVVILSSSFSIIFAAVFNSFIVTIVLGGVIFAITTCSEIFKLGPRGYHYLMSSIRLKRIKGQITYIKYKFSTLSSEEILSLIASLRAEMDEIDLELYKKSMLGEIKSDGVFIHMDNSHLSLDSAESLSFISPNGSRNNSPNNSPIIPRNITSNLSRNNSPNDIPIISRNNSPKNSRNNTPNNSKNNSPVISRNSDVAIQIDPNDLNENQDEEELN